MGLIVVIGGRAQDAPKYRCLCCNDAVFYDGEEAAYERHVVACSERHDEAMRAESWRAKVPGIFDPDVSGDVELERWVRLNRGALLEGRKKL